jgi:hypothetical protein
MNSFSPHLPFQSFMAGFIDYAGLFPPASLNLQEALDEYGRYLPCADSWMLGRFIIPASQLTDLPTLTDTWHFSVLGRSGSNVLEFVRGLEADLICLQDFRKTKAASADVFEVRLPLSVLTSSSNLLELLDSASYQLTDQYNLTVFYETTLDEAWRENMATTIASLSQHNQQTGHHNGFKLRCGGIVASAFPTAEQIAHALLLCRDRQVPFKATAGLHHPIRHYNDSVQSKMHGFVNVFGAGILAHVHHLTPEQTITILSDEDPRNFHFTESHFAWKNLSATSEQIIPIRQSQLIAFGSCSFDEPREDMQKLGWL